MTLGVGLRCKVFVVQMVGEGWAGVRGARLSIPRLAVAHVAGVETGPGKPRLTLPRVDGLWVAGVGFPVEESLGFVRGDFGRGIGL